MFNVLLGLSVPGVLGYGFYADRLIWTRVGAAMIVVWILSLLVFFIKRTSVRCPLCMVPLWANQKCQRNSKVKPVLGVSYRLGVANSVIFRGHYRCPYCGEPFSARESRKG